MGLWEYILLVRGVVSNYAWVSSLCMERTWCLQSESTGCIIVIVIIITVVTTITIVVLCNIFPLPFYDSVCAVAVVSHSTSLNKNWTEINLIICLHHCHYRSADWTDAESRSPVFLPRFCSRSVDILWWEPQSGRYSNTGTFWHVMIMVQKLINALKNSSNICTTWFTVTTHCVLSAQCLCMLHVSLTNNDSFPENLNWLFFVIVVNCVLCERGTQFLANFSFLVCVWRK